MRQTRVATSSNVRLHQVGMTPGWVSGRKAVILGGWWANDMGAMQQTASTAIVWEGRPRWSIRRLRCACIRFLRCGRSGHARLPQRPHRRLLDCRPGFASLESEGLGHRLLLHATKVRSGQDPTRAPPVDPRIPSTDLLRKLSTPTATVPHPAATPPSPPPQPHTVHVVRQSTHDPTALAGLPALVAVRRQTQPSFVSKLYSMLEDPSISDLISWGSSGNVFSVAHPAEFSRLVLPNWFKHSNWQSFVRSSTCYGFHKVNHSYQGNPTDEVRYGSLGHPSFRRGVIAL